VYGTVSKALVKVEAADEYVLAVANDGLSVECGPGGAAEDDLYQAHLHGAQVELKEDLVGGSPTATPSQRNGTYRPGIPLFDHWPSPSGP